MLELVDQANSHIWLQLEDALTPRQEGSEESAFEHFVPIALLPVGLVTAIVAKIKNLTTYYLFNNSSNDPREDFTEVVKDSRKWEKLGDLDAQLCLGFLNPNFLFGTATCTYQDSGSINCPNSQWKDWEEKSITDPTNRSGKAANLFQLYQSQEGRLEVINRLKKLGVNSYRISVEWSQIEPEKGKFNEKALQVYVDLCKHLRKENIAPMVTLHHFSEPKWFHEAGSFEKEENIWDFVNFCEKIYPALTKDFQGKPLVEHICIINEPGIEAFSRYIRGSFSPGFVIDFFKAGVFLKGTLKAHCLAYQRLKEMNPNVQIGLTHQYLSFNAANAMLYPVTRYLSRVINETTLHFFKTGDFQYKIPFSCHIEEKNLKPKTDFVGVQYYVRPVIGLAGPTTFYGEKMTEMPFHEDPAGIYNAIVGSFKAFNAPVLITESGISTHDEVQRVRYMQRVLFAVQKAAENIGEKNLRGYYQWSFCDNLEWDMGMKPQAFGAYVLENGKISEEPKAGMEPFIRLAKAWQERNKAAAAA